MSSSQPSRAPPSFWPYTQQYLDTLDDIGALSDGEGDNDDLTVWDPHGSDGELELPPPVATLAREAPPLSPVASTPAPTPPPEPQEPKDALGVGMSSYCAQCQVLYFGTADLWYERNICLCPGALACRMIYYSEPETPWDIELLGACSTVEKLFSVVGCCDYIWRRCRGNLQTFCEDAGHLEAWGVVNGITTIPDLIGRLAQYRNYLLHCRVSLGDANFYVTEILKAALCVHGL